MLNDLLNYNLKIYQNEEAFKYSIDSVLLAEFVEINYKAKRIIDLCSGNAPIPMILSQKFSKEIYGIEIQKDIYELALNSILYNDIKNITMINCDVNNIEVNVRGKFDIITCNPPYFKFNKGSKINKNDSKAIARHEILVTLEDIIQISSKIITNSGSLYLVHRCERLVDIIDLLNKYGFGLRKIQFVYDNLDSDSCFLLICAKYNCKNDLKIMKPLYIDKYLEGK
ncbi:MAG: methyltransferase [Bacilli bacterium]|nr:methyltransferase [Bacilli bacterium]